MVNLLILFSLEKIMSLMYLIRYLKKKKNCGFTFRFFCNYGYSLPKLEGLELCNESSFTRVNTFILALIHVGYISNTQI